MRTILLGVIWLCLGLSLDALSLSGRRIETVDGEGTQTTIRGEKLLRRVRRGWMWNQFFLQEEYTGSDYQYIGKVRFSHLAHSEMSVHM
uniref:Cadherin N-terminal domain-containing protein n=1 Tax=Lates calcarifer TaxID=8187 RepID=A0A4W6G4F4_LATCA